MGPRPVLLKEIALIEARDKYAQINQLKLGLAGLAQINGRNNLTTSEKAQIDAKYAENLSILSDQNFMKAIPFVLKKQGIYVQKKYERQRRI